MLVQIVDKEIVKELEQTTDPILSFHYMHKKSFNEYMKVLSWHRSHDDIDADTSIYKKWKKFAELIGCPHLYSVTHAHRNAVWGFKWKDDDVLIYYDVRGLKIQLNHEFNKSEIKPMLIHLGELLTK